MFIQSQLTTEIIKNKFTNQFDLVTYAMRLAENMLKSGRLPRVKNVSSNTAMLILQEIVEGVDQIDALPEAAPPIDEVKVRTYEKDGAFEKTERERPMKMKKHHEKKTRKALAE